MELLSDVLLAMKMDRSVRVLSDVRGATVHTHSVSVKYSERCERVHASHCPRRSAVDDHNRATFKQLQIKIDHS